MVHAAWMPAHARRLLMGPLLRVHRWTNGWSLPPTSVLTSIEVVTGGGLAPACMTVNEALSLRTFLVGYSLTVADIAVWAQLQSACPGLAMSRPVAHAIISQQAGVPCHTVIIALGNCQVMVKGCDDTCTTITIAGKGQPCNSLRHRWWQLCACNVHTGAVGMTNPQHFLDSQRGAL